MSEEGKLYIYEVTVKITQAHPDHDRLEYGAKFTSNSVEMSGALRLPLAAEDFAQAFDKFVGDTKAHVQLMVGMRNEPQIVVVEGDRRRSLWVDLDIPLAEVRTLSSQAKRRFKQWGQRRMWYVGDVYEVGTDYLVDVMGFSEAMATRATRAIRTWVRYRIRVPACPGDTMGWKPPDERGAQE